MAGMNPDVKKWVGILRDVEESRLPIIEEELIRRRVEWFEDNLRIVSELEGDELERAYRLLLLKLDVADEEVRVVFRNERTIMFHSGNFCPSLEACRILGLDTRVICRAVFERPADALVKRLNPHLRFSRNYDKIRPYTPYCEEIISLP